jgi:hypothetical protein
LKSATDTQPLLPGAPLHVSAGMLPLRISDTIELRSSNATS